MKIFAHRGLLHEYPENSLPALLTAAEEGFAIETDVRLTKDNKLILIHDDSYKVLAGKNNAVKDLTLSEAQNLQYLHSNEHFISLDTVLNKLTQRALTPKLAIHLKEDCQTTIGLQKIHEYWKKFDLYKNAFVFDLTLESAKDLRRIDPAIKIALIISEEKFGKTIHLWNDVKESDCFDIVWAAEYRKLYEPELFAEMKKKKEHVYVMSPDVHTKLGHPRAFSGYGLTWKNLIAWNVDGICTDEAKKLRTFLKRA